MDPIQSLVKSLADSISLVSSVTQGFSFGQIPQLLSLVEEIRVSLSTAPAAVVEWRNLSDVQRESLVSYVQANVVIPANATAQSWAQKILEVAVVLSSVAQIVAPVPPPVVPAPVAA